MHIIIIANHQPAALAPITDKASAAMLKVGGKTIIEHLLENVAEIPHAHITVIGSRGFHALSQFVNNGNRWGLDINLLSSRPNEPLASLRRKNAEVFKGKVVILSADRLYTSALVEHKTIAALIRQEGCETDECGSEHITEPAALLTDHKAYLEMNLAAARGDIPRIRMRGRERALGLTTGYMTQIDPRSVRVGQTLAGNHCRVHKSAQLSGTVVLNSGVVVDRNTRMNDVLVLDHTYVGEHLNFARSIVSGQHIIRVDEGVVIKLTDSFMAAPLHEGMYAAHFSGPSNQIVGAIAAVFALPLMGLAMLTALWQNPYNPIVQRSWASNRAAPSGSAVRVFDCWEFNVSHRGMARLPQLFSVALGHMRWFGVSPATADELADRRDARHMIRDTVPTGMFGHAQLHCDDDASTAERFSTDAAYVPNASWRTHFHIGFEAVKKLLTLRNGDAQSV